MSFLSCKPSVFVIGKEYEILINTHKNGICMVKIGEELFYENTSGVLSSEQNFTKIRVPQEKLNEEKSYQIIFRETINRKGYFSEFAVPQSATFAFKPLEKTEDIHIYHIADVHYHFELALNTVSYFGEELDLLVVNGDIGEVETEQNYFEVCKFIGEASGGSIPILFSRGNHDTRGKLAERFVDYFPNNNKKTFYSFEIGCLNGVVLDCGEDKPDMHREYGFDKGENLYGGTNIFERFRREETDFLKSVSLENTDKITFSMTHICPQMTTFKKGDEFDIERELYQDWTNELERIGVKLMLCGHYHKAFVLDSNDERNIIPHKFPVVVGSACFKNEDLWGAAITLNKNSALVEFTNKDHNVVEKHEIVF